MIKERSAAIRLMKLIFAAVLAAAFATTAADEAQGERVGSIGYATVVEALIDVQKGMDTESRMEEGWTIVERKEKGVPVHWFFTHKGHPAHPAAIKRTMTWRDGAWEVGLAVLCEGPKTACEKLTEDFRRINEKLEKSWSVR